MLHPVRKRNLRGLRVSLVSRIWRENDARRRPFETVSAQIRAVYRRNCGSDAAHDAGSLQLYQIPRVGMAFAHNRSVGIEEVSY